MRVHVLGAGCFGLSAALALTERGHEVEVHDPRGVGGGATGRGAGIVSTMTWNDDDYRLIQRTRGRIGELLAEAAMEGRPEARLWRSCESITIAGPDDVERLDGMQRRVERLGEETERLDWRSAAAQWPAVRFARGEEVLVAQEDGAVEPGDLATLLAWAVQERGGTLRVGGTSGAATQDAVLRDEGGALNGPSRTSQPDNPRDARQDGSHGRPDATVVAAGAWTPRILAGHGVGLPMASFRTQLASIQVEDADDVPIVHDTVHGFYMRPESSVSVLAGDGTVLSPHDPDDHDEAADTAFRDSIANRLVTRLTNGKEARWRSGWAGLCVGTPDRRPLCGAAPGKDGLFVLSGDNGFGIMRCLALGERLADAVEGREVPATSPARFADHEGDWQLREGFAW